MALNPALDSQGVPVPFVGEMLVLTRTGIEFHINNLPCLGGGAKWVARGTLFLSTVRMVFVPSSSSPPILAFDLPLLFVHGEKFNQPIFGCNNVSANVFSVQGQGQGGEGGVHEFVLYFMEGGVGTFLPLFFSLLRTLRAANPRRGPGLSTPSPSAPVAPPSATGAATTLTLRAEEHSTGSSQEQLPQEAGVGADPIPIIPPSAYMETLRSAYVDPNDPTVLYVEQPSAFKNPVRRRHGYTQAA